jgi:hypothetical protein
LDWATRVTLLRIKIGMRNFILNQFDLVAQRNKNLRLSPEVFCI